MDAQQMEAKYNQLRSDYRLLQDMMHEAETQKIEEIGRDGFASDKTRKQINELGDQIADADFELYCFERDNAEFVAQLKAKRAEAKEAKKDEMFEKFWNN